MSIRTRFAPSPTGYLHIGGARTALFSWLHARKHGGTFILRIEDTDLERSSEESVNAILEGMTWLGLNYDEGPFYQTKRFDRYSEIIAQLMAEGKAYKCYCSKDRLEDLREKQMANKHKPRYDGLCRPLNEPPSADAPYVIRFRNPDDGVVVVDDLIRGKVVIDNRELDDLIIQRSDGTPTYNLTVVVDDMDMAVSHVIRGDDHLNNAPRQINILRALGAEPPVYAHVPMILGEDGKRLSKRHGAVSVMQYYEEGYLPEALLNYLVRLGWSHGDQEIFSMDEMVQHFDVTRVNKAASVFNPEKLLWLNQHYIKESAPAHLVAHFAYQLGKLGIDPATGPDPIEVIRAHQERAQTLAEMADTCSYVYRDYDEFDEGAAKKNLRPVAAEPMKKIRQALSVIVDWNEASINAAIEETAEALGVKMGKIAQPLRVAVVGRAASPGIDITLKLAGKEACLRRIDRALEYISAREIEQQKAEQ